MKSAFSPLLAATVLMTFAGIVQAQNVSDVNVFNPTGTAVGRATVNASSTYDTGSFPFQNADDGSAGAFVFADYLRGGGSNTNTNIQTLSFSGFTNLTGISSLRFYDTNNYEPGRVATQVTIYTSTTNQTSLLASDYSTNLGTFLLPVTSPLNNNAYTGGTGGSGANYDTLTGLNIGANVQSILLDFGPESDHNGGPTYTGTQDGSDYNVGTGFQEIQAFAAVPEPSAWAMMLAGVVFLVGFTQRRLRA